MKKLTLKALLVAAVAAFAMNAQASTYDDCIADGNQVINLAKTKGAAAAKAYKQKTTVVQCFAELRKIEAPYGDKTVAINPSYVMSNSDRAKWAKLFDSIDAKRYKGVPFLIASYYGHPAK